MNLQNETLRIKLKKYQTILENEERRHNRLSEKLKLLETGDKNIIQDIMAIRAKNKQASKIHMKWLKTLNNKNDHDTTTSHT